MSEYDYEDFMYGDLMEGYLDGCDDRDYDEDYLDEYDDEGYYDYDWWDE